jgi:pyrroloquinoline quinone biosynthesis protein B
MYGLCERATMTDRYEAILLGNAQDAGLPQAGCHCPNCTAAWAEPALRRYAACLAVVDHETHDAWLLDATPDFREQWHALEVLVPGCRLAGMILTHAHIGHYAGLVHVGREAWGLHGLPVYCTAAMAAYLTTNGPWSQLVMLKNIDLREMAYGVATQLSPGLAVTPHRVPHRDEYADTVALMVHGPRRRLFYCPDINSWDRWDRNVREFLRGVDVALLDATFYSLDELSGRHVDVRTIQHPLATDTVERLEGVDCDVRLVHLNHSNPLHHDGPEREYVAARGISVAAMGDRWVLG